MISKMIGSSKYLKILTLDKKLRSSPENSK